MRKLVFITLAVVLVGGAIIGAGYYFVHQNVETTLAGLPALVYPGFKTWPTPRTFDGPGSVFQEKDNTFYSVGQANLPNKNVGTEALVTVHTTGKWKGDVLAQFTGAGAGTFGIKNDQDLDLSLQFDGAERWRIEGLKLGDAIKAMMLPFSGGGNFYVVREAISVRRISYKVAFSDEAEGAASAKTAVIGKESPGLDGKIVVKASSKNVLELEQAFTEPHYVFYLASQVIPASGFDNAEVFLRIMPESEPIKWAAEVRPGRT
jgi:hypothetical protein